MTNHTIHTPAGRGPHQLVIGSVTVSQLFGGSDTGGQFSLVKLSGLAGSGPGAHIDPWRETFYVLEGELTFRFEQDGAVQAVVAGCGDAVTIPAGVGHAFSVTGPEPAQYLILSTTAGIDVFFADAGEPIERPELPSQPLPFDRERLLAAFAKHGNQPYRFPAEETAAVR